MRQWGLDVQIDGQKKHIYMDSTGGVCGQAWTDVVNLPRHKRIVYAMVTVISRPYTHMRRADNGGDETFGSWAVHCWLHCAPCSGLPLSDLSLWTSLKRWDPR